MKTDILKLAMTIEHLCQAHSVSCLLYHIVSVVKYRKKIFIPEMEEYFKKSAQVLKTEQKYSSMKLILIMSTFLFNQFQEKALHSFSKTGEKQQPKVFLNTLKNLKASSKDDAFGLGYYNNTLGLHTNQETIQRYIQNQGRESEYKRLHVSPCQLQFKF